MEADVGLRSANFPRNNREKRLKLVDRLIDLRSNVARSRPTIQKIKRALQMLKCVVKLISTFNRRNFHAAPLSG